MNTAYCIYAFVGPEFDKMKVYCVMVDEWRAKRNLELLAKEYPENQFFMESVLFYP